MITISLNQIKAKDSCKDGWEIILAARGGKSANHDEQFPLSFALDSNGLEDVLWALQCLPEHDNLWRKYAVWCARQVEHSMTDQRSKDALDVAWRHSDGLATDDELRAAGEAADRAADAWAAGRAAAWSAARAAAGEAAAWAAARDAGAAAWAAVQAAAWAAGRAAAWTAARATAGEAAAWSALAAARDAQTNKLRKILDAGEWV